MIYPLKVELPLFNLKYNTIKQEIAHYIEFHETHLIWVLKCYIDVLPKTEDGEFEIKENQYTDQTDFVLKSNQLYIYSYYCNTNDLWVVSLNGISKPNADCLQDCKFETEAQMRQVEKVFHEWLIKTNN